MIGVLAGFVSIGAVIVLGYLLATWRILDHVAQDVLTRLVFFVATPALLFHLLSTTRLDQRLGTAFLVALGSAAVAAILYVAASRLLLTQDGPTTVVGALASSYVNAGNLGLPICVYVLGDGAAIAPILLLQLLVIAPLAFWLLDRATDRRAGSPLGLLLQPVRNPVTVASFLGLLVATTGVHVPTLISQPIDLVAGIAVPGALVAYGISLRLGPTAFAQGERRPVATAATLKLIVQPFAAWVLGSALFGLTGRALLTVVLVAGLPTAQNIFIYASRYERGVVLARDAIFVTTVGCLITLTAVAALLA